MKVVPNIKDSPRLLSNGVTVIGEYHPYHGGQNPSFDRFSGQVLDLKEAESERSLIVRAFGRVIDLPAGSDAVAVVPPHRVGYSEVGIGCLGQLLCKRYDLQDLTRCLRRSHRVEKLSTGGDREMRVHLESIMVMKARRLLGLSVVLVDDVTTTGNSLLACEQILLESGAREVWKQALALTVP